MPWRIRRIVNRCAAQQLVARRNAVAPEFNSYGLVILAINREVCLRQAERITALDFYSAALRKNQ
jgi:hypothetical protein